jgi:hypothetical protein
MYDDLFVASEKLNQIIFITVPNGYRYQLFKSSGRHKILSGRIPDAENSRIPVSVRIEEITIFISKTFS